MLMWEDVTEEAVWKPVDMGPDVGRIPCQTNTCVVTPKPFPDLYLMDSRSCAFGSMLIILLFGAILLALLRRYL